MELLQHSGVSVEYKNGQPLERFYFYLTEGLTMTRAIGLCNDEFFMDRETVPEFIEYTETESWCKLIHGISDKKQLNDYFKYYSGNRMLSEILEFASKHNLMAVCPGKYAGSDIRSVYLLNANERIFLVGSASLRKMYSMHKQSFNGFGEQVIDS